MKSTRRDDRHYMSSVRVGPKGQIVIPKEAREMFGIEPGDMLVLLADKLADHLGTLIDPYTAQE